MTAAPAKKRTPLATFAGSRPASLPSPAPASCAPDWVAAPPAWAAAPPESRAARARRSERLAAPTSQAA